MSTSSKSIICCGFTPCVQRIIEYARFQKGAVNRAKKVTTGIGGKGANTARMVSQLGERPELLGFVGGANGRLLETLLTNEGVGFRHVVVAGETRICQTLVEVGDPETTELVEEMPPLSTEEWARMVGLVRGTDFSNAVVTISGKLPDGAPVNAYAEIAAIATDHGGQVVIDAPGEPLLLALEHKPLLVKINDVELLATCGGDDLPSACRGLISRGAQSVLITRGARTAFYVDAMQVLELFPPKIKAVNPVGSGDAVTAGIAVELSKRKSMTEAIVTGMACGAANALNLVSGVLKPEDVARLRAEVRYISMN